MTTPTDRFSAYADDDDRDDWTLRTVLSPEGYAALRRNRDAHVKNSPLIRLQHTRQTLDAAVRECGHWDYENEQGDEHACCFEMREAYRAHKVALTAWRKAEAGE